MVGLMAFWRRRWEDRRMSRLPWVFVSWMRKCSYFGFSMAVAVRLLELHTAGYGEVHPHRIYRLIVATVLIISRTWNMISLYNMRLAVVIHTLIHFVNLQSRPVTNKCREIKRNRSEEYKCRIITAFSVNLQKILTFQIALN